MGMSKKRLLIICFSSLCNDARVMKQIKLFTPLYEVITCGYGQMPPGVAEHVQIPDNIVHWHLPRWAVIIKAYNYAYQHAPIIQWLKNQSRLFDLDFDAIFVNDLEPLPFAIELDQQARKQSLAEEKNKKQISRVHVDLHEYFPRMKEDVWRWRYFVAPYVRWMCKRYLPLAASHTSVGEGIAKTYKKEFGILPQVVNNATPYSDLEPQQISEPMKLVTSGVAREDRKLEMMIEAVAKSKQIFEFDMFLMGGNPRYREFLIQKAADASVGGRKVRVLPGVPYAELLAVLNQYDVGINYLDPKNFNNYWALPNKFFDYIQARLAVVVPPLPELSAQIKNLQVGEIYAETSSGAIAKILEEITPEKVMGYKQVSHQQAKKVCAEAVVKPWEEAVENLMC